MKLDEILEAGEVLDKPPVKKPEEIPLNKPGGATVMILNDPVTPFEVVIEAVVYGTGLSVNEASSRVQHSHNNGWAAVATYGSREIAETVADKIQNHARNNTKYDFYKRMSGHQGPWPLTAEVINE